MVTAYFHIGYRSLRNYAILNFIIDRIYTELDTLTKIGFIEVKISEGA